MQFDENFFLIYLISQVFLSGFLKIFWPAVKLLANILPIFISLIGTTPEAQSDSVFEAANLLMNLAFWHMKHSAMLAVKPDLDMEEAKKCHTSLRKAAGNLILHNIRNLLISAHKNVNIIKKLTIYHIEILKR